MKCTNIHNTYDNKYARSYTQQQTSSSNTAYNTVDAMYIKVFVDNFCINNLLYQYFPQQILVTFILLIIHTTHHTATTHIWPLLTSNLSKYSHIIMCFTPVTHFNVSHLTRGLASKKWQWNHNLAFCVVMRIYIRINGIRVTCSLKYIQNMLPQPF
jgi:hypothetical protein